MAHSSGSNSTATSSAPSPSLSGAGRSPSASARRLERSRTHDKIKISVSYPSSDAICSPSAHQPPSPNSSNKSSFSSSPPGSVALYAVHYSNTGSTVAAAATPTTTQHLRVTGNRLTATRRSGRRRSSSDSTAAPADLSPSPTYEDNNSTNKPKLISRMNKRNIKAQVKRFRMETKAAKTLGIIVGGFIVCWLPFFTMYLVRAFCKSCIHPLVFSVLFWLGYCNSAINPCIYALFSKDFRFAFKRIICRCFCKGTRRRKPREGSSRRRGSDGSQLGARGVNGSADRGRSPSCTHSHQEGRDADDSDPNNDGSDSR